MNAFEVSTTVLLLDDCQFTRRAIKKAIESSFPRCEVIVAASLKQAQKLAGETRVDLFLIDSHLPDGSGIEFWADLMVAHSKSQFILLADGAFSNQIDRHPWLETAHVLRKAVDRVQLVQMMRELLGSTIPFERPRVPGLKQLTCLRLKEVAAADLVYFQIESRATTLLEFISRDQRGEIHFINGKAMYAEVGDLEGKEALEKIMSWKSGFAFQVQKESAPPQARSDSSATALSGEEPLSIEDATNQPTGTRSA